MKGEPFVPATKIEPDGMTLFGWEKSSQTWAILLDGRRFDVKNKPVPFRTFYNRKKAKKEKRIEKRATKKDVNRLVLELERKKRKNNFTWARIAKFIDVKYETIRNWRNNCATPTQKKIKEVYELLEQI
jgi:hypothetical protein